MSGVERSVAALRRLPRWVPRVVISVVCIAATAWWVSQQGTPHFPSKPGQLAILAAAAAMTLCTAAVRGWRWAQILKAVDIDHLGFDPYLLTTVGYMGNTVLPARGGDVLRVGLLTRRFQLDWKTVTGTLIPERLLDLISLGIALIGLSIGGAGGSRLGAWPAILSVLGIVGIVVAVFGYRELRVHGYLEGVADKVRPFTRSTRALLTPRGALLLLASLGLWTMEAFVLWLVIDAAYQPIAFASAAFIVVIASLATAVPAAPGFLGTLDAAVIFGLGVAGVPANITFTLAVLYRVVIFAPITFVGAIVLLLRYGGRSSIKNRGTLDHPLGSDPEHEPAVNAGQ